MIRLLFLAANPKETEQLGLTQEIKKIDDAVQKAKYRDQFHLEQRHAVNITELQELLLRFEPSIIHFSGHGSRESALVFEQEDGNAVIAPPDALTNLFRIVNRNKKNIQCVVLNACYSEEQAEAIGKHIPCVIGMSTAISDEAAIKFATSFYRVLANGYSINDAFELGLNDLDLQSIPESGTPKLKYAPGVDPAKVYLAKNSDLDRSNHISAHERAAEQSLPLTGSMLESLTKQHEIHTRNLSNYQLELAKFGGKDVPVRLTWDIDYTEKQIALLEKKIEEIKMAADANKSNEHT